MRVWWMCWLQPLGVCLSRTITPSYPAPQVKFHDIHHWYPDSNYGQYIMLWDHAFGWFKPYPKTGKASVSAKGAEQVEKEE